MKFELFTAYRYLRSKKDNLFISKLLAISILTVTLAITIPILVLSVINGFHQSIKEKVIAIDFHIKLKDKYGNFHYYSKVLKELRENPDIELAVPFFEGQGLIKMDDGAGTIRPVMIKAFYNEDLKENSAFNKNFTILSEHNYHYHWLKRSHLNPKKKVKPKDNPLLEKELKDKDFPEEPFFEEDSVEKETPDLNENLEEESFEFNNEIDNGQNSKELEGSDDDFPDEKKKSSYEKKSQPIRLKVIKVKNGDKSADTLPDVGNRLNSKKLSDYVIEKKVKRLSPDEIRAEKKKKIPFEVQQVDGVLIGDALSSYINIRKGESLKLLIPQGVMHIDVDPENIKKLTVENIYSAGYAKFNRSLIFIHFNAIKDIFQLRHLPTDIGVNFKNDTSRSAVIKQLKQKYPHLRITNTLEEGLFKDFSQEKKLMNILLYFLIFSAFLTIYIALNVVVMDKRREIGTLKAIGTKIRSIQLIFVFEGILISFIGVILGNLLGFLITTSLKEIVDLFENIVNGALFFFYHAVSHGFDFPMPKPIKIIDDTVFYIKEFPYKFNYTDILLQTAGAIFVSLLAAYFPSKKASQQEAADSLRP